MAHSGIIFSDDDLMRIAGKITDPQDQIASLLFLIRSMRQTIGNQPSPSIHLTLTVCHELLEGTLREQLIEMGWDL